MRSADGYIINKCLNGEPEAYGVLVDRYRASMFALAYSKLCNFEDAEDVTQDAFILAYKNLRKLKQYDSFHTWLYSITSNLCKKLKIRQSRLPDSEFIEDQHPGIMGRASMNSYREDMAMESIHEALDSLPKMYREVLTLHYLGGMSSDEIAEALGASPGAIRQRLIRARAQLRKEVIAMMGETLLQRRLSAKFTFNIVETIKRIRINPVSTVKGLPWGLSLATGIMIAVMSLNSYIHWFSQIGTYARSVLPSETNVLKVGEIPVDVIKTSKVAVLPSKMGKDKGGEQKPDMQNMAPQAEGGTWTRKADMPETQGYFGGAAADGKIYAIGGSISWENKVFSTVNEYDPAKDMWTRKTDTPVPVGTSPVGVMDGKIHVFYHSVFVYDPSKDKWEKKGDILENEKINEANACCALNRKIYLFFVDNKIITRTFEYDPQTDTWQKKADMLTIRYSYSTSAVNGKIYAIGGVIPNVWTYSSAVEEYDPVKDTWMKKTDMPTARASLSTSVINDKIYAIGGSNGQPGFNQAIVEVYDPIKDKWTKGTDMQVGRNNIVTGLVNGKIYVIGGWDDNISNFSKAVEEYTPEGWPFAVSPNGKLSSKWGKLKSR